MDVWEQLREKARTQGCVNELQSVKNALWEADGGVYLAVDRGLESKTEPRTPQKRPWFVASVFLLLGAFAIGATNPSTMSDAGRPVMTLPFNPISVAIGLLFAGIGYCILCGVSRLILDRQNQRWTLEQGVFPFVKRRQGVLDTAEIHWEMGSATRSWRNRPYEVWMLRLVGVPTEAPGRLELPAFDLRQNYVDRETALQAYQRVAEQTGIRLVDDQQDKVAPTEYHWQAATPSEQNVTRIRPNR